MSFKDLFSKQSEEYSKYRPVYPHELFQYLNSIVSKHDVAVDCATGNGQAARGLAEYFNKVIAIDASSSQIENAFKLPNIEYKVGKAEETGLESKSADLVSIATAIHWVNIDLFYEEAKRVLKDYGVLAVWTYGANDEIEPGIDEKIISFSKSFLSQYWDEGIKKVWNFDELYFPFKESDSCEFEIKRIWKLNDFLNYAFTWSSVQNYIEINKTNPVDFLKTELGKVWDENESKKVTWKIKMKTGRNSPEGENS